jgi:hypothetical protein
MGNARLPCKTTFAATIVLLLNAAPAGALTRTWVSGEGNDANPCTRQAPCRTFTEALSKTAINGEITCLNEGGFGSVTINKSVTIDCSDTQAKILGFISINITAPAAEDPLATVRLHGLRINGTGSCGPRCGGRSGVAGISVAFGNTRPVKLFVENVFVHGFHDAGINFAAPGDLVVRNSSVVDNHIGIMADTQAGRSGRVHVTLENVNASLNDIGVFFDRNTSGVVKNSTASNNAVNGFQVFPQNQVTDKSMNIMDSTANNNKQFGVVAGPGGIIRLFNVTVYDNGASQLELSGGQILSNGKNHIGTPTAAPGAVADQ